MIAIIKNWVLGIALAKGTIITCPANNVPILEVKRNIYIGDPLMTKDFKGANGRPDPRPNQYVPCGALRIKDGKYQMHTEKGWSP